MREARKQKLSRLPYGRRTQVYRKLADELEERFDVERPWQGIQQRIRLLIRYLQGQNEEPF